MFYNKRMDPRGQPPMSGISMERDMRAPPRPPVGYFNQPGTTEKIPPLSSFAQIVTSASAPAPVAQPTSTAPAPKPILHSFDTKIASETTAVQGIDVTTASTLVCVKDSNVVSNTAIVGAGRGFLKGVGEAIITRDPSKMISSTVGGFVTGSLKGEALAAQTCILALPKNEPPKP